MDSATVEEAAALLREVLETVDSAEVPVGRLPRETATRRRVEGASAALEALAADARTPIKANARRHKRPTTSEISG
jgi:hypothetical protein